MNEKRKHIRYKCELKAKFQYFETVETDEEENSSEKVNAQKGKGTILDISQNGLLIATNSKLGINIPITVAFKTKKRAYDVKGRVVRIGFLENNPSEVAKKFLDFSNLAEVYIAVQFDELLDQFEDGEL